METPAMWRDLDARLRGYFRRRVHDEALADDLVQETFSRILDGIPTLRDRDAVVPWAYRVARSALVDHVRRARPGMPVDDRAVTHEPPEDDLNREVASWLLPMMSALPEPDREALQLADVHGIPQVEIAARLGLSPSGARTRVQRARKRLLGELEACCRVDRDRRGNVLGYEPRRTCCDSGSTDSCR